MKTLSILALPAIALTLATACPGGTDDDSGDTETGFEETDTSVEPPAFAMTAATWTCSGASTAGADDDSWYFYTKTDNWMASANLSIAETSDYVDGTTNMKDNIWVEHVHEMGQKAFDENRMWDEFDITLSVVTSTDAVVKGTSTLFNCASFGADTLTFRILAAEEGGSGTACVAFGHNPGAYISGFSSTNAPGGAVAAEAGCVNGGAASDGNASL